MHDGNTKRTTNERAQNIKKITAKQFASLKLANGEAPPTLKSALKAIDGKVPMLIELKPDGMRYKKSFAKKHSHCLKVIQAHL